MSLQDEMAEIEVGLKASGVHIKDLCKEAGTDATNWSRWKNGASSPSKKIWDSVLDAFSSLTSGSKA